MTNPDDTSVIIIGAGPVGLTVAALLLASPQSSRLRINVLESRPAPAWSPDQTDLRVYALSRASQRILEHAGAWQEIAAARASRYGRMQVWEGDDATGLGSLTFDCAELGEPDLGHIVEDRLIRDRLYRLLDASTSVELRAGSSSRQFVPSPGPSRSKRNPVKLFRRRCSLPLTAERQRSEACWIYRLQPRPMARKRSLLMSYPLGRMLRQHGNASCRTALLRFYLCSMVEVRWFGR